MSEEQEFRVQRRFIKSPDTKSRDEAIAKINAEIKQKDAELAQIKSQLANTVTDPKVSNERKALLDELKELRKTQGDLKGRRTVISTRIREIDSGLKRKISEVQAVTSKYNFKSAADVDSRIQSHEDEIATGHLSLVEERRLVKEISNLRKVRKDFSSLSAQQESIDADKAKIAELKKELSTINSREISEKFESVQKKLDELSVSNKSVNEKRDALYKKRNALHADKDTLYASLKKTRDDFDKQFKAFKKALADERQRVANEEAKFKTERAKSERKAKLDKELAEASRPAFTYEIDTIHALLTYFDPTYVKPEEEFGFNSTNGAKKATPAVDAHTQDYVVIKKENDVFLAGTKTGKKHKKSSQKKFTLEPDVISQLGDLDLGLPTSKDDVPKIIEDLKTKLDKYSSAQKETTEKNIEAAKAKIAQWEAKWAEEDAAEAAKAEADKENVPEEENASKTEE